MCPNISRDRRENYNVYMIPLKELISINIYLMNHFNHTEEMCYGDVT